MSFSGSLLKRRFYAFMIDLIAIVAIDNLLFMAYKRFLKVFLNSAGPRYTSEYINSLTPFSITTLLVVFWSYFFFSYYLGNGQTLGKFFLSLRVYPNDKSEELLSMRSCIFRSAGYIFGYGLGLVILGIPFLTKSEKGIPDWLSGSYVSWADVEEEVTDNVIPLHSKEDDQLDLFQTKAS